MRAASPLRYPGGKSAMAGLLAQVRKLNLLGDRVTAEPFGGGAGASISLLFREETPEIYINDLDPAVSDFWWAIIKHPRRFAEMLSNTRVNMAEWRRQRDTYRQRRGVSRLRRGFSAFYLNRCNRSGIIMNGGPIGGVDQRGAWRLDARFNKAELLCRCQRVSEYSERIHVSCRDGLEFIGDLDPRSTFFFVDPPYFLKGKTLYLNGLSDRYHEDLAARLESLSDAAWVLTYDDCPEVRRMYRGWSNVRPFSLQYVAAERRTGGELLITPKWLRLPHSQASAAIMW